MGLLLVRASLTQGPALLAALCWWTARDWRGSWSRDEDQKLLERACQSWGRKLLHVFDRGEALSLWLGAFRKALTHDAGAAGAHAIGLKSLVVGLSASLEST